MILKPSKTLPKTLGMAATLTLLLAAPVFAARLVDGTPVRVRMLHVISSETSRTGDRIELAVLHDIVTEGQVTIRRGAVVTGTIVEAAPARIGFVTRRGRLAFQFDQVRATDGQTIRVRARAMPDADARVQIDRGGTRHLLKWAGDADTFDAFIEGDYDVRTSPSTR